MSKRFRLFVILILAAVAVLFLLPTINWYGFTSQEDKDRATSSMTQIKKYAIQSAGTAYEEIKDSVLKPFVKEDFKDAAGLVKKIKDEVNGVAKLIKGQLTEAGKVLVDSYSGQAELSEEDLNIFINELNTLREGILLYSPEAFSGVGISTPTKTLAEQKYSSAGMENTRGKVGYLNRFLLEEAFSEEIQEVMLDAKFSYLLPKIQEFYQSIDVPMPAELTVKTVLSSFSKRDDLISAIEDVYREDVSAIKEGRNASIQLGLDLKGGMRVTVQANFAELEKDKETTLSKEDRAEAMERVLGILNNRIDQFGVTEPLITQEGEDRILIEMPGMADPDRIKNFILGKGRLNFHIVNKEGDQKFREYIAANPDYLGVDGKMKDPTVLPAGTKLFDVVEKDRYDIDQFKRHAVLNEVVGLSGNEIAGASVYTDPRNLRPYVTFELSEVGQETFFQLTKDNVNETMAVVLDDKIKFQATINEPIRGSVRVSGIGFNEQEAMDLEKILKTGALPVPLEIIELESVGASLGAVSIQLGLNAIIIGLILVMVFMFVYYLGGGIIANIALTLNFFFMISVLSMFMFTLTLPGIAGFILTVGMAVDANVIIFERIKEEYRLGKSRKASIKAGFSKAFWTIFDANITTAIAALALAYYGKGPIKGFATVLTVGIVCSMFTSLFVSRLLFDFGTDALKATKLRLMWRNPK